MAEVKWVKLAINMFDDEKVRLIESMPEGDSIIIVWCRLLCLAGKCNAGGYVFLGQNMPYTDEMLATIFGRPLNTVRLALEVLRRFEMIEIDTKQGIFISNFAYYQDIEGMERIREQNRQRQALYRARHDVPELGARNEMNLLPAAPEDNESSNVTVTLHNGTEIDREIEEESISVLSAREEKGENEERPTPAAPYIPSDRLNTTLMQWQGVPISPVQLEDISDLITAGRTDEDLILEAVKIAKDKGNQKWDYALGILRGLMGKGYATGAAYRQARLFKPRPSGRAALPVDMDHINSKIAKEQAAKAQREASRWNG